MVTTATTTLAGLGAQVHAFVNDEMHIPLVPAGPQGDQAAFIELGEGDPADLQALSRMGPVWKPYAYQLAIGEGGTHVESSGDECEQMRAQFSRFAKTFFRANERAEAVQRGRKRSIKLKGMAESMAVQGNRASRDDRYVEAGTLFLHSGVIYMNMDDGEGQHDMAMMMKRAGMNFASGVAASQSALAWELVAQTDSEHRWLVATPLMRQWLAAFAKCRKTSDRNIPIGQALHFAWRTGLWDKVEELLVVLSDIEFENERISHSVANRLRAGWLRSIRLDSEDDRIRVAEILDEAADIMEQTKDVDVVNLSRVRKLSEEALTV